tara:strand:+ start:296 stop:517 length:222 start_codon:yes stop_codon:yes gene_type:complete
MHVDRYVVNNIGIKWTNGKSKKNQLLCKLEGDDGIDLKKLVNLVDEWHETVNGEWSTRDVEVIINVKDNSNHV